MSHLYVPTVTSEDLLKFQADHFFASSSLSSALIAQQHHDALQADGAAEAGEEGDDLGYYPDGVKRTLTVEQIRIFRHSEIHNLLRERQRLREQQEEEEAEKKFQESATESRAESKNASNDSTDAPKRESGETRDANGSNKRTRYGSDDGYRNSKTRPASNNNNKDRERPINGPPPSQGFNHGRRIISYAED